jgi:L-alanine-DL-glutamate epimerase-like enolase superfamily enzyme
MPQRTIFRLSLHELRIPFKVAFRHASAERTETSSIWVEALSGNGVRGFGESCPRPYVTGESIASARRFFDRQHLQLCGAVSDLPSLHAWMTARAPALDANPAAWCAIELALLDLMARERGQTIEAYLSLPPLRPAFRYTAVLGDMDEEAFRATAERYRQAGFADFKVKLSGDPHRDREKVAMLRALKANGLRVRADANNLWESADQAIATLDALDYPFFAIEEPIRPNQYAELARIAKALDCPIVLDESFLRLGQLEHLAEPRNQWLINLRVSKMGGLTRSLAIVEAARAKGIGIIVGAQVGETSLLTRAGLTIANAAGDGLVAQEGAFGTLLLAHDICDPPLMFGAGGVLDVESHARLRDFGLGIVPTPGASNGPGAT